MFVASAAVAQTKVAISGYVRDASTGEELLGATVSIPELTTGIATNTCPIRFPRVQSGRAPNHAPGRYHRQRRLAHR